MSRRPTPARQYALLIIMIGMIASGFAAIVALLGEITIALYICAGSMGLAVIVLLFGGLVVAASDKE